MGEMEASRNHHPLQFAQMSAPLTGPWVAPQMLGTVKQESWGGDGLSWEDGGLLNYKEKGKSSSLFNALTAIINFLVYTVLLEPQIQ